MPSPQPRPAPTARALPPEPVAQEGQNWTPIGGQIWKPIDKKGANRIGASRLEHISRFLQVPVAFFFEGASVASAVATSEEDARSLALMNDFVSSPEGLRLVQSFTQIEDADVRRRIVDLVQAIGSKN